MLIFDQLKKNDPQLRVVAVGVLCGLAVLVVGLWWVQIVSSREYQAHMETQSFRTVRMPAVRGKIFDRSGTNVLAENRPTYNVSLYLEELRSDFGREYERLRPVQVLTNAPPFWKRWLGAKPVKKQYVRLSKDNIRDLTWQARYRVASNVVAQVSERLLQPISINSTNFQRHYQTRLFLPFPVLQNLNSNQIARFEEQSISPIGVDLEVQSTRVYPFQTAAAHVLGSLKKDDSSDVGEEAFFSYRLPDFRGTLGVEAGYDAQLRGKAGAKSLVVNSFGYRRTENVWTAAEPGQNVILTIDIGVQQKAERALQVFGPTTRGAAVVMDVRSGDILALASSPTFNPNYSVQGWPQGEYERITTLRAERNRATQENYAPGSIFKTVVGLACLEAGLNPDETIYNPGFFSFGPRSKPIMDLAPPGTYDFRKALMHSSNTYFITNGLKAGIENIIRLGQRLHLGERTGLQTRQETSGHFPDLKQVAASDWRDGQTANICIGQGKMDVTPLQMAVMTAAIANNGTVLWPRLVERIEPQDPTSGALPIIFPPGQVRDKLGVKDRNLRIVRDAMFADVQDPGGTGTRAAIPGYQICGKTGTAQVMNEHLHVIGDTVWFVSFAPYEQPRYAVVVMIEVEANSGASGGKTCAPIAGNIYRALLERERKGAPKSDTVAIRN